MKKEEQEECVKLLKHALALIQLIPNKGIPGGEIRTSKILGDNIEQLLNKLNGKGKKI